jgi:hypothetical protein
MAAGRKRELERWCSAFRLFECDLDSLGLHDPNALRSRFLVMRTAGFMPAAQERLVNRAIELVKNGAIAVAMLAPFVYLALHWTAMPATVPSHFGINGQPDAWGPRWNLFLLPACALVVVSLLTVGKRFSNHFNYPVKVTEENRERQRELGLELLDELRFIVAVLLGYISIQQMRTALNLTNGLGVWMMLMLVAAVFGTLGAYFVRSIRAR